MGKISNFGDSRPATTGTHMGTDFSAAIGTPIYSNIDGTVSRITQGGNYGLRVEISDGNGTTYELAHLDATNLSVGQKITTGDFVAYSGNSGNAISTPPHTHYEARPEDGSGIGPYGTTDSTQINPNTGRPYSEAFGYGAPGNNMNSAATAKVGQTADGYTKQGGTSGNAIDPTPGDPNDKTVPADLETSGYKYEGYDEGGKYYLSEDENTSLQYDAKEKQWIAYDANTGEPLADQSAAQGFKPDTSNMPNVPTDSSQAAKATGGAPMGANGQEIGGAGCLGGGLSPAQLTAGSGLMANIGGLAQNAAMGAAMAALSGGGIQGIMGGALGSAAGALGNSLGASLGGAGGAILGQTLGGAVGALVAGANPLQALTGSAFGALSQMGGSLIPGLSNVMPPEIAGAAINGLKGVLGGIASGVPAGAAIQMGLAGGLSGLISNVTNNMTGNYALGSALGAVASGAVNGTINLTKATSGSVDLSKFTNLIQTASAVASGNRVMVGAIVEAMGQNFGNGTGGLGSATRNMQDAMTFSITTLGQDINAISADMIAIGDWDATNLMRLMQPGNVAYQIMMKGLGDVIGLTDLLVNNGVAIAGVDNPLFDRVVLAILTSINDTQVVNTIKTAFHIETPGITNLGDLCNIQKMMPNSIKNMPVRNFRELGVHLAVIGINSVATIHDVGIAFSRLETSTDLNHISQLAQPLSPQLGSSLLQVYGYGGGSLGEQTMADIIGTPAGYVHTDTIPIIVQTNDFIMKHSEAQTLVDLTTKLNKLMSGQYTDLGTPADDTANPPIPSESGSINVPGIGTFNTLDQAVLAFVPLIEAEHATLLNTTDPKLKDAIDKLNVAWRASCAQIVKENNNLQMHDIDIFDTTMKTTPTSAMMFAQSLDSYGLETGYGQIGHYLERVASNDVYGDAIKYSMRQARNGAALANLGVDIEKYKLPRSQYYRDPEGFYTSLYTGQLPPRPQAQSATIYPRTPEEVYITNRTQALANTGMDIVPLLNNQKDEIYYDSLWTDIDQTVLDGIGQNVVKNIVSKNISIVNTDLILRKLDGTPFKFGEIKPNGLLLTDNEQFINLMLSLVNRALYGNVITSKYNNPFNTDQMIYGLLEMLGQVNFQNIQAMLNTITGGIFGESIVTAIRNFYIAAAAGQVPGVNPNDFNQAFARRSLFDTTMDRNDPAAWGGTGPDSIPT